MRAAMALLRSSSLIVRGIVGREASTSFSSETAKIEYEPHLRGEAEVDKGAEHTRLVIENVRLVLVARLIVDSTPVVSTSTTLAHVTVEAVARDGSVLGEGAGVDGAFGASHNEEGERDGDRVGGGVGGSSSGGG